MHKNYGIKIIKIYVWVNQNKTYKIIGKPTQNFQENNIFIFIIVNNTFIKGQLCNICFSNYLIFITYNAAGVETFKSIQKF